MTASVLQCVFESTIKNLWWHNQSAVCVAALISHMMMSATSSQSRQHWWQGTPAGFQHSTYLSVKHSVYPTMQFISPPCTSEITTRRAVSARSHWQAITFAFRAIRHAFTHTPIRNLRLYRSPHMSGDLPSGWVQHTTAAGNSNSWAMAFICNCIYYVILIHSWSYFLTVLCMH